MAQRRIVDRSPLATPAAGDVVGIVDVSDTSQSAQGTDKYITYGDLTAGLGGGDVQNPMTSDLDAGGHSVYANLGFVLSKNGTLTADDSGRGIITTGDVTIPQIAGFNCVIRNGGGDAVHFNGKVTAAGAVDQVCTVFVWSSTVATITPWVTEQTLS